MLDNLQPIKLVSLTEILHADYNPRKVDENRLTEIERSLSYLGFLVPIYRSKKTGVLLSGHQRSKSAKKAGFTHVPVVDLDIEEKDEKGLNLIFNKVTNDLDTFKSSGGISFYKYMEGVNDVIAELSPLEEESRYPCLNQELVDTQLLLNNFKSTDDNSLITAGIDMVDAKIYMPVIVDEDYKILNGLGRFYGYLKAEFLKIPVVKVNNKISQYVSLAMNNLSMDFNIQEYLADELRYNAFRRKSVENQLRGLSRGWNYHLFGRVIGNSTKSAERFTKDGLTDLDYQPFSSDEMRSRYKKFFGAVTVDMGAGSTRDAQIMIDAGVKVLPFEPYFCPEDEHSPNLEATRKLNTAYLEGLRSSKKEGIDTVVSSFVLNSIPHHKDRMAYLIIIASMFRLKTKLVLSTQSVVTLQSAANSILASHITMNSSEPNMLLGKNLSFFKSQKYYKQKELESMLTKFFSNVEVKQEGNGVFAICRNARRLPDELIVDALRHEFELPFSCGNNMGLSDLAIDCFSDYLGRDLLKKG